MTVPAISPAAPPPPWTSAPRTEVEVGEGDVEGGATAAQTSAGAADDPILVQPATYTAQAQTVVHAGPGSGGLLDVYA
jgi:hypothetical protein